MVSANPSAHWPRWRVLFAVVFGLFMVILDSTVVNVALRTLQGDFHASVAEAQWVISVYVMAVGIATPVSSFAADRLGGRRVFIAALALFALGSLLCAVSPSLRFLIAARAIQGLGGGLALPLGTAMLYQTFPAQERGKAFGVFGIALVAAPALGPILGGWLVTAGHWRWIFLLNVPIGILGVILGRLWLPVRRASRPPAFDPIGLACSTIGFGAILYGASVAGRYGWSSPHVLAALSIGIAALLALAVVELHRRHPLLDVGLLRVPRFTLAASVGWVSVVALFGAEFLLPLYLQVVQGRTALDAGVILLPLALASGVAAPIAGILYDRIGARALAVAGFGLLVVNTWQLTGLTATTPLPWLELLLVIRGLALGLTIQTTLNAALGEIELGRTQQASALITSTRNVAQSIAVAVLGTILATAVATMHGPPVGPAFQQAYLQGLTNGYRLTMWFSVLAALLSLLLPGWPFQRNPTGGDAEAGEAGSGAQRGRESRGPARPAPPPSAKRTSPVPTVGMRRPGSTARRD